VRTATALLAIACVFLLAGCAALTGIFTGQPPTAAIMASPISGLTPLLVHFDASRSDDDHRIVVYTWDFGDGTTETSPSALFADHRFERPGSYAVCLTVTDEDGMTNAESVTITVENRLPLPSCRLSNDAPVVGERVQFDASGSFDPDGELVDFTWEFGDGETMRGTRVSHVYTELAVLTMRLTVEDDAGGIASTVHTITVHQGGSGGGCRSAMSRIRL
jgi:PKD repeat protein